MAFSPAAPPKRAGDYTRFVTKRASTLPPSTGSVVTIPFVDDWGPLREFVLVNSFEEYLAVFGEPTDLANPGEGYIAVYNAFRGEDDDHPGAGGVLCYRHGGSAANAAVAASKGLNAGANAPALTLTAKYTGTRGNQYKVEVVANAATPATQVDVRLYLGNLLLYTFGGYSSAAITTLQDDINRVASNDFVASGAINGVKLDLAAPTAFTAGADGGTMIAGDWTATRTAIEGQAFGIVAPANLTDPSIQASLVAWCTALNAAEKSKRFFLVEGGIAGESFTTASTRSSGANNENVVNLGVGTFRDKRLGLDLSTAQLATRLAGVMAARGGRASLSFAYLQDLEVLVGPSEADILSSFDQGVVVIGQGTGGSRIERGVTTYTTKNNTDKDFETYSRIKYVSTMQNIERGMRERNESARKLGILPVNNDTRESIVSDEQTILDDVFVRNKELQPGAKVVLTAGANSDDEEFVAIDWIGKFSRSLEQVRRTVVLS